jgi:hypothetical protein
MNAILIGARCGTCDWPYGYRPSRPEDFPHGRFRPEQVIRYCPRCEGATVAVQWALAADVPVVPVVGRAV